MITKPAKKKRLKTMNNIMEVMTNNAHYENDETNENLKILTNA